VLANGQGWVNIILKPAFLAEKLGVTLADLHSVLHPDEREVVNPWVRTCQLSPQMKRIVKELRACIVTTTNYLLHAEAMTPRVNFALRRTAP